MTSPSTMRAIRLHRFGGPEVLALEEIPTPQPGSGEILIRIETAAVNYADLMRRRNDPYPFPTPLPFVPGGEVAGTVERLGDGVDGPPIGTPVFAVLGRDGSGGYAEHAVTAAAQVIPIPPGVGADEASTIMVAGTTAVLALREAGRLAAGETVLLPGAAGGVGSYAVQIAKRHGARVIAAAGTTAKREAALALGADHVVDSAAADWPERVRDLTDGRGADVVLEATGGPDGAASLRCLAPFGRLVVIGATSGQPIELDAGATRSLLYDPALNQAVTGFNVGLYFGLRPDVAVAAVTELCQDVADGRVKVSIGHVLPLAEAAEAHRLLEARQVIGKVVLHP